MSSDVAMLQTWGPSSLPLHGHEGKPSAILNRWSYTSTTKWISMAFVSTYVSTRFNLPKTISKSLFSEAVSLKGKKFSFRWSIMVGLILYLHAAWRSVLLEKLTVSQLVKNFPAFYVTRIYTAVLATCPYYEPDQSISGPHIPLPERPP